MLTFLQYYSFFILSIVVMYFLGKLALSAFKIQQTSNYYGIFLKVLLGTIIFTVLTALIATKGKTILIIMLPIGVLSYFFRDKSIIISPEITKNNILLKLLCCFAFTSIIFFIRFNIFYQEKDIFSLPHSDYVFYAKSSFNIFTLGIENALISNSYINSYSGVGPYHYFELWLNAGLAHIFGNPYLPNLMLITFSLLISLMGIGFLALAETINKKVTLPLILMSFFGLFITGVYIIVYDSVPFLANMTTFARTVWNYSKFAIIYIFLTIIFIEFLKNKKITPFLWFVALPVAYTTTAPSAFLAVGTYIVVNYFFIEKKLASFLKLALVIGASASGIILFYLLFSEPSTGSATNLKLLTGFRTRFNIIVGTSIQIGILYLPFLLISLFYVKKIVQFAKVNHYFFFIFLIFIFSLFSWAIMCNMTDMVQLFSNISVPMLNISMLVLGFYLIIDKRKVLILTYLLFIMVNIYYQWNDVIKLQKTEITTMRPILEKLSNKKRLSISFRNKEHYNSVFSKNTIFDFMGQYLLNTYSDAFSIDLSVHKISIDSTSHYANTEIAMLKSAIFYQYVEKQKQSKQYKSIVQSQLDFIKDYKIDYAIINKNTEIPSHIHPLVQNTLTYKDDKFLFLKEK